MKSTAKHFVVQLQPEFTKFHVLDSTANKAQVISKGAIERKDMITHKQVEDAIKLSLKKLEKDDKDLFILDANERTLTHRMSLYLEKHIKTYEKGWNVDCEYNRDVTSDKEPFSKKVDLMDKPPPPDYSNGPYEDENATTVYPDIIVHKRKKSGHEDGNLLVIEVKKSTSSVGEDYDKNIKLPAYLKHLKYKYACFIMLETKDKCRTNFEFITLQVT